MKQTKPYKTSPNARSDAEKLALATGSLSALSLLSFGAQANIIYTDAPFTTTVPTSATTWSVDNSGRATFTRSGISAIPNSYKAVFLRSNNGEYGRGVVQKAGATDFAMQNLPANVVIGPTMAGYQFGAASYRGITSFGNIRTNLKGFNNLINGYFGFQFTDAGLSNTFYGWAEININAPAHSYTINRWAYNTVAGQSIKVGDTGQTSAVPEPGTLSLTLLGLGAGGVRAWRKRKQALAA